MDPWLMMIFVIFILFWLLILRPQKREQAMREQMLNELAKGDQVLTNGGIIGTIEGIDKEKGILTVSVAPKVTLKFTRNAVASILQKKGAKGKTEDS